MRSVAVFALGIVVGAAVQSGFAQQGRIVGLNHVAVSVEDYEGARRFYGTQMGFREAFSFRTPEGDPYFTYFQISKDTFVEVMQATPARPVGCPHFGLEVEHLEAVVDQLKARGVEIRPISVSPRTAARSAVVNGPGGVNMELLELGPRSLHRKVMDSWK